jgi:hypothetical protein
MVEFLTVTAVRILNSAINFFLVRETQFICNL